MKWIVFFFLILIIFISLGFWHFYDPGYVSITWLGYEVQFTLVAGFIILLLCFLLAAFLIRLGKWLFGLPHRWFSFFQRSADEEFLKLLCSYEAETYADALHHQKKAAHNLWNNPIFLWISGNAFNKAEKPFEAEQCFMELTKNPSTSFLGLKGQIRAAMHRQDFILAYHLLQRAEKLVPSSPWVLKHYLAISREQMNFKEAERLIRQLEDLGYLSPDQSQKQRAFLFYQQAMQPSISTAQKETFLKQAHKLDPSLIEAAEAFSIMLQEQNSTSHALKILEETWALNPKQILGDLYLKIASPRNDTEAYQISQNLVKKNPKNPETLLFLARIALQANLWGEARAHLTNLLKIKGAGTSDAYQLFAKLELIEHQDWKSAIKWLEKGLHVPRHV